MLIGQDTLELDDLLVERTRLVGAALELERERELRADGRELLIDAVVLSLRVAPGARDHVLLFGQRSPTQLYARKTEEVEELKSASTCGSAELSENWGESGI